MGEAASKPWGKLIATGTVTAILYTLLFTFEKDVMASFTRTDGLYPLLPVAAAFAFSLSHGAFTGYFWMRWASRRGPRPCSGPTAPTPCDGRAVH